MKIRSFVLPLFLLSFSLFLLHLSASPSAATAQPQSSATSPTDTSLLFIENAGQFDKQARFQVRGGNGTMWLAEDALWLTLLVPGTATLDELPYGKEQAEPPLGINIKLSFVGSNSTPQLEPFDLLETSVNYFVGSDPNQWQPHVPVWRGVRYIDLYPGIDFEVVGETNQLLTRLVCQGNCLSALQQVRLQVVGAETLQLNEGHLIMTTPAGDLDLPPLSVIITEGTTTISLNLIPDLENNVLSFSPSTTHSPLALTPAVPESFTGLLYGTFLGGNNEEMGEDVTVDSLGHAYVTGHAYSTNFPTTPGTFDPTHNGGGADGFVVKLDPTGSSLVYATFLGGSGLDAGTSLALDEMGYVYVTGYTQSADFPTTPGAYDVTIGDIMDSYVVKLNPDGSDLVYATFLGGESIDEGYDIALDEAGNSYLVGMTVSTDFPTTSGAFDPTHNGALDTFVAKLNAAGTDLLYSTYLGSDNDDLGSSIGIDGAGNAYVVGFTNSVDFPTTPTAYDPTFNGSYDAFVSKLNATGSDLSYATFLGGGDLEGDARVALNETGNAYVLGYTHSADFPATTGAYDTTYNGDTDAFVAKFDVSGSSLIYATFLGGTDWDSSSQIAVDEMGSVYVVGDTSSGDFPTTPDAFDTLPNGGGNDTYLARLDPAGSTLTYGTYIGGINSELSGGLAIADIWLAYMTGSTISPDFPTTPGAFDPTHNSGGIRDAFVIQLGLPPFADFFGSPTSGWIPLDVTFTNLSSGSFTDCWWNFGDGATSTLCNDPIHTYEIPGHYTVKLTVQGPGGMGMATKMNYIVAQSHSLFLPWMTRPQ